MTDCRIPNCAEVIKYSAEFPLCPYHFRQKISIDLNHCLIKLCENERHEAFSFCEKHCDEFFEKEESELLQTVEQFRQKCDLLRGNFESLKRVNQAKEVENKYLKEQLNHLRNVIQGMKKEEKPEKPSLTREILKNEGVVMCTVDTMKKILNDG